jgi:hypothetical protein
VKAALQVLNGLVHDGIIQNYGIGGAMGAMFYAEPVNTIDLDVFVLLPEADSGLLSLSALYEALQSRGHKAEAEYIVVDDIPIQFLPAYNSLLEEALQHAVELLYDDVPASVLRVEYLLAICVQTGRAKDRARVSTLLEQADVNTEYLHSILERHDLTEKWKEWTQ